MGLALLLLFLVIVGWRSKGLSQRFFPDGPDLFWGLCATAFIGVVILGIIFDRAGPGNEMGPVIEVFFFYPLGLIFWVIGLVILCYDHRQGRHLGFFRTALLCVNGLLYIGTIVIANWLL